MSKFIAAMDHSGGSTGGVLDRYEQTYTEKNKMDLVHKMRLRMVNSPDFTSENIWAAILYKDTVERGMVPILKSKGIKSYLKIDSGCEPNGYLKHFKYHDMIEFAIQNGCSGTKMRSIVKNINQMDMILEQQFALAEEIYKADLMPIVEPEIPIDHHQKQNVEDLLHEQLSKILDAFKGKCILKLTLPEQPNFYKDIMEHKKVHKVVGLSGGYSTKEACKRLSQQDGMSASFSRGLSEGLYANQSETEFNYAIAKNIHMIKEAGK